VRFNVGGPILCCAFTLVAGWVAGCGQRPSSASAEDGSGSRTEWGPVVSFDGTDISSNPCESGCEARVCGLDPVCGESCGRCPTGQTCTSQGTCCEGVGPVVIDSVGEVENTSLGLDAAGRVHISYRAASGGLKYATNVSGQWATTTVDSVGPAHPLGSGMALALDAAGKGHIGYYDSTNSMKYATNASGVWVTTVIDSEAHWVTSLTLDAAGQVHIYYGGFEGNLKYATNVSGAWLIMTLDFAGAGPSGSFALDSAGKVHISFHTCVHTIKTVDCHLRYATNASGSWVTSDGLDSVGMWGHSSLALDASGKVHIGYAGPDSYSLKYATNASGTWATVKVDSDSLWGTSTSLALDAAGKVHISYLDGDDFDLKYATNASGTWTTKAVDSAGDVGEGTSLALDAPGKVHISYSDMTNGTLKYVALCPE